MRVKHVAIEANLPLVHSFVHARSWLGCITWGRIASALRASYFALLSLYWDRWTFWGMCSCCVAFCNHVNSLDGWIARGVSRAPFSLSNCWSFFTQRLTWLHPYTTMRLLWGDGDCEVPWCSEFRNYFLTLKNAVVPKHRLFYRISGNLNPPPLQKKNT